MSNMTGKESYLQEVDELLTKLEEIILDIESRPVLKEDMDSLFRIVHTIKGSGAMFGFDKIVRLTHNLETVLELARDHSILLERDLITLILKTSDQVKAILTNSENPELVDYIIAQLQKHKISASTTAGVAAVGFQPPSAFPQETTKHDDVIDEDEERQNLLHSPHKPRKIYYRIRFVPDRHLFKTGTDPAFILMELHSLGKCSVTIHTEDVPDISALTPEDCYFSWDISLLSKKSHVRIKDVFLFVEHTSQIIIQESEPEAIVGGHDGIPRLGDILIEKGDIVPQKLSEALDEQKRIGELLIEKGAITPSKIKSALTEQKDLSDLQFSVSGIRVPAGRIDHLINLVGELVITKEKLLQDAIELEAFEELNIFNTIEEVGRLTNDLRDCALEMRMLPIGGIFGKFRRLVRDLSTELGKEIRLVTEGAETELDKNIIERLNDPLIHLIRNSIDHGIQLPEERLRRNLPREGIIRLAASYAGAHVNIVIEDDGSGIDHQKVFQKAVKQGLVSADSELTDEEIFQLIFQPGFSTTESITDISGRGVGMDVVKRSIDALGGVIKIRSRKDEGALIQLSIPLTLAIIDGLLISVDQHHYVLQLCQVKECLEINQNLLKKMRMNNMIPYRNGLISLVRLRDVFMLGEIHASQEKLVVMDAGDELLGVVVDDIHGTIQTVIKTLDKNFSYTDGISGATILGDGSVALVLDARSLMKWTIADNDKKFRLTRRS